MSLSQSFTPFNEDHSIKEAVISLFLASPIIKPERFSSLIESDFQNKFQQFQNVSQLEIQVKNTPGFPAPDFTQQVLNNTGFRFLAFEKGKQQKVLQGVNEPTRNFISYHSLNYSRWAAFYGDYLEVIGIISKTHPGLFVTAVSLHYMDEFLWNSSSEMDMKQLFNDKNNWLPSEFFTSRISNYSIITNKEIDDKVFFDRLEVNIEYNIKPSITVSHNVTQTFDDVIDLEELIANAEFAKTLDESHKHNKDILNNILTADIRKMIKLT